jgi:hypothetical protein
MVDVLRIASVVYFADRIVKRDLKGVEQWCREISCSIPVRDADFWNSGPARSAIQEAVDFVSGDKWMFDFAKETTSLELQTSTMSARDATL